jgi:hypothetical protein
MIFESLTPKSIILNAIKDKCEGTGIAKIVLYFNTKTEIYNVMFSKEDNTSMKMNIEEKEINLIKRFFVSKIKRLWEQKYDNEVKAVILQFDLKDTSLKIFIEDENSKVTKFDY